MAEGFLLGEEDGVIKFAAEEGFVFLGDLEERAATGALGEDDFRDVEEWIDAGDLLDLLADEFDRGLVGDDGYGDAFGGRDEFLAADLRAAATAFLEISAVSSVALASAFSSFMAFSSFSASAVFAPGLAAALWVLALGGLVGLLGGWLGFGARPRGAEREFGQKAVEGIGRVIAHVRRG